MSTIKKIFTILYFKISYLINDVLDINHLIVHFIAFAGGYLTALYVVKDKFIIAISIGVVSAALNEFFKRYFKNEPDMIIVAQSDNTDDEFMKQIGDTITHSIRSMKNE